MDRLQQLRDAIIKGEINRMPPLVQQAVDEALPIRTILDELIGAMGFIGERFKKNEIFIPEVMISAKAMHAGMRVLEPHLIAGNIRPVGSVIIGTVKGDLHDIGKNIVGMMFKGAGFQVTDLGIDVAPERFLEAVKNHHADIMAMSSLITSSMESMAETIRLLVARDQRDSVRVMVGGAPVTQGYADRIGADGYARDAASAVDRAKELLQSQRKH